ncbi:TPA: MarR family winged helix-turn-helix transcriptional regulator [Streptococcus pneumoniae]
MDKKEFIAFNNRFNRFILAFDQLKKNQHKSGVDKSVTLNDVHLIVAIGKNQPLNLVKLSELLEVSRSAITQSVRRLIQKNLVVFDFDPNNGKNKYLRLSEKGIEIFKIHKEQQAYIEKSIFSVLNNYSEVELKTVVKLMDDIEKVWGELPW